MSCLVKKPYATSCIQKSSCFGNCCRLTRRNYSRKVFFGRFSTTCKCFFGQKISVFFGKIYDEIKIWFDGDWFWVEVIEGCDLKIFWVYGDSCGCCSGQILSILNCSRRQPSGGGLVGKSAILVVLSGFDLENYVWIDEIFFIKSWRKVVNLGENVDVSNWEMSDIIWLISRCGQNLNCVENLSTLSK